MRSAESSRHQDIVHQLQSNNLFGIIWYRTGLATTYPFVKKTANTFEEFVELGFAAANRQDFIAWLDEVFDPIFELIHQTLIDPA